MPELAEVDYYRRRWALSEGQSVVAVQLNSEKRVFRGTDAAALQVGLMEQPLVRSATHGKQMYFVFGRQHWLGVHLGMTGKLLARSAEDTQQKHDHLILTLSDQQKLVFTDPRMFGRILYEKTEGPPLWLKGLPPEILSEAFTFEHMNAFLNRHLRAPIKAILLMQEAFPGIGNWMADEVLWRAQIPPAAPSRVIEPKKRVRLFHMLKQVCEDAMQVIAPDWGTPPDGWLFNHRWKDGGLCPKTGAPLRREKIGGRTTCWSPEWQGISNAFKISQ